MCKKGVTESLKDIISSKVIKMAATVNPANQCAYVKSHVQEMDKVILRNKNILEQHKKGVTETMEKYPDASFKTFFDAVKEHNFIMTFFEACKDINLKEARRIHKTLKKLDEKDMNKQLFEEEKAPGMIFLKSNGRVDEIEGDDQVTINIAKIMKESCIRREEMIEDIRFLRKHCQFGILLCGMST
jgi:hypothetical protein